MPLRPVPLVSGEYYHIYNRGVARQPIFTNKREYNRFIGTLVYYRFHSVPLKFSTFLITADKQRQKIMQELEATHDTLVEILAFVLMPNHFHLLLKQTGEQGITTFIGHSCNSFSKYINTKHKRVGPLFQGPFKYVHVVSDEQLLHLSRYIHLNPLISFIVKEENFLSYPWSSLPVYLSRQDSFIHTKPISSHFKTPKDYQTFLFNQVEYAKTLEQIKHLTLEKEE